MSKKYYRFYGGLITAQEKWLNHMAGKGYRLIHCGKLLYEFEPCEPNQYQYCIDFIADKSKKNAEEYAVFLEECGYQVYYKNINLNYFVGKVRWRPWAKRGGQIATNATTFNRELLIVEKVNDGKEFQLHTTFDDRLRCAQSLRNPWLLFCLVSVVPGVLMQTWVWGIAAILTLIPTLAYQMQIRKIKAQAKIEEW